MNQLILKKSDKDFYFYDRIKKQIVIFPKRNFKNITLGIIIDTALKIPPNTGVTYRLYYLSKKLVEKGIKVKVFLCNRNFKNDKEVKSLFEESSLEFHIIPEKIFYDVKKLNKIIKINSIDILQVEDSESLLRCWEISRDLKIPFCLEIHDIEAYLKEMLGYHPEEVNFTKAISYFACELAEKVICTTPLDYNELIYRIRVEINKLDLIPNPIDLQEFPYYGPNLLVRNIIFIGNMFYLPNQNAIKFIRERIYPKIKGVKFIAIGMVPDEIKRKFSRNNFIFTHNINNLNNVLKEATLALCPVTKGSGMKVKILNYCAAGLPVITTKIGASGYEMVSSLIVENDLNKYPEIINKLLDHPNKMKTIGKKNRIAMEKYYDLGKIADKMIQVYQEILNSFHYKNTQPKDKKILELPIPFWLREKRVKKNRNNNYYVVKNGKIIFKKEFNKIA